MVPVMEASRAVAHRQHGDHGGNADHDAQDRQPRAQLVRVQALERLQQELRDGHAAPPDSGSTRAVPDADDALRLLRQWPDRE